MTDLWGYDSYFGSQATDFGLTIMDASQDSVDVEDLVPVDFIDSLEPYISQYDFDLINSFVDDHADELIGLSSQPLAADDIQQHLEAWDSPADVSNDDIPLVVSDDEAFTSVRAPSPEIWQQQQLQLLQGVGSHRQQLLGDQIPGAIDRLFDTLPEGDKTTQAEPAQAVKSSLYPHQKQGLNWMMTRENGNRLPSFWEETQPGMYYNTLDRTGTDIRPDTIRGGLLADDMGLGKTLQVISLIVTNFVDGYPLAVPSPYKKTTRKEHTGKPKVIEGSSEECVLNKTGEDQTDFPSTCSKEEQTRDLHTRHEKKPLLAPKLRFKARAMLEKNFSNHTWTDDTVPEGTGDKEEHAVENVRGKLENIALMASKSTEPKEEKHREGIPEIEETSTDGIPETKETSGDDISEDEVNSSNDILEIGENSMDTNSEVEKNSTDGISEIGENSIDAISETENNSSDGGSEISEKNTDNVQQTEETCIQLTASSSNLSNLNTCQKETLISNQAKNSPKEPAPMEPDFTDITSPGQDKQQPKPRSKTTKRTVLIDFDELLVRSKKPKSANSLSNANSPARRRKKAKRDRMVASAADDRSLDLTLSPPQGPTLQTGNLTSIHSPSSITPLCHQGNIPSIVEPTVNSEETDAMSICTSAECGDDLSATEHSSSDKKAFMLENNCDENGRTFRKDGGPRGTLIVCPLSVLSNWQDQLREHVYPNVHLEVHLYYGPSRCQDPEAMSKLDIVITTYGTLLQDYRNKQSRGKSPLLDTEWLRLVLDEGHCIRNYRAKQTKAVMALEAERKWVLTGTPIQNKMLDLWSLVKFLGVKPLTDRAWWNTAIEKPLQKGRQIAFSRVQGLMDNIALRRTKTTFLEGKPLIQLPKRDVFIERIKMSDEERKQYQAMEEQGKVTIKKYASRNLLLKKYILVLEIMLRLRQMCCHRGLLPEDQLPVEDLDDDDEEEEVTRSREVLLQKLMVVRDSEEECSVCMDSLDNPVILPCAHYFCHQCVLKAIEHMEKQFQADASCPLCRAPVSVDDIIELPKEPLPEPQVYGDWTSSTKVDALMSSLVRQREEDPTVKSLVVSQFTSYLSLIETPLWEMKFKFVRLDGTMSVGQRKDVLHRFSSREEGSPSVFLLSLHAGGVGLNLNAASRVYLMEPHWNPATEEQCFDRCHRLGQTRDVVITKFIAEDTIEERMIDLQERKRQLMQNSFKKKTTAEERKAERTNDIRNLMMIS